MRKVLTVIGAVAVVVVLFLGAAIGYTAYEGAGLDRDSKAFTDSLIQNVVVKGRRDELVALFSADLRQKTGQEQLDPLFNLIAGLGPLSQYEGSKGESNTTIWNGKTTITAAYTAKAKFEAGEATFQINLVKSGSRWEITNLHMEPAPGAQLMRGT